jgi:hypothetical protein
MLVFLNRLCELLPLKLSLWLALLPLTPFLCEQVPYTVYMYTVCKGGGEGSVGSYEGKRPQTDETPAAKSIYRSMFLYNDIWHCFSQSNLSTPHRWVTSNLHQVRLGLVGGAFGWTQKFCLILWLHKTLRKKIGKRFGEIFTDSQ